jgi:hypothetical protein
MIKATSLMSSTHQFKDDIHLFFSGSIDDSVKPYQNVKSIWSSFFFKLRVRGLLRIKLQQTPNNYSFPSGAYRYLSSKSSCQSYQVIEQRLINDQKIIKHQDSSINISTSRQPNKVYNQQHPDRFNQLHLRLVHQLNQIYTQPSVQLSVSRIGLWNTFQSIGFIAALQH